MIHCGSGDAVKVVGVIGLFNNDRSVEYAADAVNREEIAVDVETDKIKPANKNKVEQGKR